MWKVLLVIGVSAWVLACGGGEPESMSPLASPTWSGSTTSVPTATPLPITTPTLRPTATPRPTATGRPTIIIPTAPTVTPAPTPTPLRTVFFTMTSKVAPGKYFDVTVWASEGIEIEFGFHSTFDVKLSLLDPSGALLGSWGPAKSLPKTKVSATSRGRHQLVFDNSFSKSTELNRIRVTVEAQ